MKSLNVLILFSAFLSCEEKVEKNNTPKEPYEYYKSLDVNKYREEVLDFDSTFINGNIPLITSKTELIKLFGRLDKTYPIIPSLGTHIFLGIEEKIQPYYLVFGKTIFESVGDKAIVNTIDFESANIIVFNPKITLSRNTTAREVQKVFPESGRIIYYTNGNTGRGYMILKTYPPNAMGAIWFLTFENSRLKKIILYRIPYTYEY